MERERYEIKKLLGKGRTGGIYLAEDTQSGEEIAMRRFFFQHSGDDSDWQKAFQAVDLIALRLQFPNTLPVTDAAIDEDGPYIITPYLKNATKLSLAINNGEQPTIEEFQTITTQLLTALTAIHNAGQTHGALSPNAILITKENHKTTATLTDGATFQIAENLSQITNDENPIRDPSLTAPEILKGGKPSPRADIYSLGHTLYALWHSGHPYAALTTRQILQHIKHGKNVDIRESSTPLPKALNSWLHKAMHPNPKERIQDANQALSTFTNPKTSTKSKTPIITIAVILLIGAVIAAITIPKNSDPIIKTIAQKPPTSEPQTPTPPVISNQQIPIPKKIKIQPKPSPPIVTADPIKITPPTEPEIKKSTPTRVAPTAITKGNYTFQIPTIFTTNFNTHPRGTITIPLDHEKQYAWAILNNLDLQKTLKGGANKTLSKIIAIEQIGKFTPITITQPKANYTITDLEPIPETFYADVTKSNLLKKEGWRITIKIPNIGTEPLNIGIDTRSALTKTNFTVTSSADKKPTTFTLSPPDETIRAVFSRPTLSAFHSRQTITIEKPTPNSILIIDVTVGDTYLDGSNYENLYSLSLNAITIWRD